MEVPGLPSRTVLTEDLCNLQSRILGNFGGCHFLLLPGLQYPQERSSEKSSKVGIMETQQLVPRTKSHGEAGKWRLMKKADSFGPQAFRRWALAQGLEARKWLRVEKLDASQSEDAG